MLRRTAAQWCRFNYGRTFGEWCYRDIVPRVFAEELIGDGDPDHLVEYKIFCFAGEPRFIKVIRGMKGTPRSYYADLDGRDLGISDGQAPLPRAERTLPEDVPEMIALSRLLAADFDLIRVDLYHTGHRIYVGELTNYPQAGIIPFHPPGTDRALGRYWHRRDMPYLPFGPGPAD